jgi:hypothetical protein
MTGPNELLVEADLVVVEDDGDDDRHYPDADASQSPVLVKAAPVRRKRQVVAVGVGTGSALLQRNKSASPSKVEPIIPEYNFTSVMSLQADFNRTLPGATMQAVNGSTDRQGESTGAHDEAMAYRWLFRSDPDVWRGCSTVLRSPPCTTRREGGGGSGAWMIRSGWVDPGRHECLWHGVPCGNRTADEIARCKSDLGLNVSVACRISPRSGGLGNDTGDAPACNASLRGTTTTAMSNATLSNATSTIEAIDLSSNALRGGSPTKLACTGQLESSACSSRATASRGPFLKP